MNKKSSRWNKLRKALVVNLVLLLMIQPVVPVLAAVDMQQAVNQLDSPMAPKCAQMDTQHCADMSRCTSTGHSGCDYKSTPGLLSATSIATSSRHSYAVRTDNRYRIIPTEVLLKPPRNY